MMAVPELRKPEQLAIGAVAKHFCRDLAKG
jgi:hypothetical protein